MAVDVPTGGAFIGSDSSSSGTPSGLSSRSVSSRGDSAYERRVEAARLAEEETRRITQQENFRRLEEARIASFREAERRAREEQARGATSSAAVAASSSTMHPMAGEAATKKQFRDLLMQLEDDSVSPDLKDALLYSLPLDGSTDAAHSQSAPLRCYKPDFCLIWFQIINILLLSRNYMH